MEAQSILPGTLERLLPAFGPAILISTGYVDPGKWAATIDGGARFGFDLVLPMLLFSFAAILCQYLSARIGVVTGRDLAQICSDEYDRVTCLFLGVETSLSVIALDLTMIIGIAHGLNLLFGVDLSTCVFLTAIDAVLYPLFATFLERCKGNFVYMCIGGFILLFYFLGVLISQPEIPPPTNGFVTKLSEGSAFALMSLLGANIIPHYFYLHSSIVLRRQEPQNVSKGALCHDHFASILCIFSGIYLVNYVLMNSAANVFYSTGLVLLTFLDAMSLMEQVLRSPVALFLFLIILYLANKISALTWNLGGQGVMRDFLQLDIPYWLQHSTIRIIAIVPALYCVWTSGVEGLYQLLIFTQVMVALLLPSSVIPLFRVASSTAIMGAHKISQFLEFLSLITFMGMIGLQIIFVVEMIFGDSDWVGNLRWNMGSSSSVPYIVLLVTACSSFCLMLWLAATPLKSATPLDAQAWNWEVQNTKLEPSQNTILEPTTHREENISKETTYNEEEPVEKQEHLPVPRNSIESCSDIRVANAICDLPKEIMKPDRELHLTTIEESRSDLAIPTGCVCYEEEATAALEPQSMPYAGDSVADSNPLDAKSVKNEFIQTVALEGDLQNEKEDDEVDTWEAEESCQGILESTSSLTSDGPGSFRSLSGKSDEGGNGTGSLSRLAGLGRAARRQFASVLDEFWGQLFDFHGLATQEAKTKRLDALLFDTNPASMKLETAGQEVGGYFPSVGGRVSDSLIGSSLCNSPRQPRAQSTIDSSHGVQRASSSLLSNHMQLLDPYVHGSSPNDMDSAERRYSSVRTLPSSSGWDNQPATIHGYQIASIVNQIAKDRNSNHLHGSMDSLTPSAASLGSRNYRDALAVALGQNLRNGLSSPRSSGFQSAAVSRNIPLQSERPYYDVSSPAYTDNSGASTNAKKYHSLPDISGLSGPYRNQYMSENGTTPWGNSIGYGSAVGRTSYEPSYYSNARLGSSHFSNSGSGMGVHYLNNGSDSIWSKQPYEQFGAKTSAVGSGVGSRSNLITREATLLMDSEGQLLWSFRCCMVKLLKLEGSDWLFRHSDGVDEDLIDRVAAREKCLHEAEAGDMNVVHVGEPLYSHSDKKFGSALKNDEAGVGNISVSSVPHCGDSCVWRVDLIISFGVWCIHRILDLSLMESRPELWGKYTYVLNRLQGIIDPAFSKPRSPMPPCLCLHISGAPQFRSSPPVTSGLLPPTAKPGKGKCTTATTVLDLIKDVELAISCRKGRSGTAAGDVAFPKGKENLASVLKRYKRKLSNKQIGSK